MIVPGVAEPVVMLARAVPPPTTSPKIVVPLVFRVSAKAPSTVWTNVMAPPSPAAFWLASEVSTASVTTSL